MNPVVSIRTCDSYAPERVQEAVFSAIEAAGGLARVVRPGMRVLIKINLLNASLIMS